MSKKVILIGGGVHAFSICSMLESAKGAYRFLGYVDSGKTALSLKYLGTDAEFCADKKYNKKDILLVMGMGINITLRRKLFKFFKLKKYNFLTYIHPSVISGKDAKCEEGCVVFPGSILGPGARLEKNVCLHSGVIIEHRTVIGEHGYISPGVTIAGDSRVGEGSFFGIKSGMADSLSVGKNTIVGAGSVVLKDFVKGNATLVGTPAREIKR